jgi:hypothetical protein
MPISFGFGRRDGQCGAHLAARRGEGTAVTGVDRGVGFGDVLFGGGWVVSVVSFQTLHIRLEVGDTDAGGAFDVHQWKPTSGDQTLDGSQRNTELLRGFTLGEQQAAGHS